MISIEGSIWFIYTNMFYGIRRSLNIAISSYFNRELYDAIQLGGEIKWKF